MFKGKGRLEREVWDPRDGSKTANTEGAMSSQSQTGEKVSFDRPAECSSSGERSRYDASLGLLTLRFRELLKHSSDGILDIKVIAHDLNIAKRRIYDVTNVLEGISLLKKKSKNTIEWLGAPFNRPAKEELSRLEEQEKQLDELIQSCTNHIHQMCTDHCVQKYAYLTHEDLRKIPSLREQTVMVIKAPAETKLEVSHPHERFQVHLKSTQGPIDIFISANDQKDVKGVKIPRSPVFPADHVPPTDHDYTASRIKSVCTTMTSHSSPVPIPSSPFMPTSLQLTSDDPQSTDTSPLTFSLHGQQYILSLTEH